jgi:hypothetical protein
MRPPVAVLGFAAADYWYPMVTQSTPNNQDQDLSSSHENERVSDRRLRALGRTLAEPVRLLV